MNNWPLVLADPDIENTDDICDCCDGYGCSNCYSKADYSKAIMMGKAIEEKMRQANEKSNK